MRTFLNEITIRAPHRTRRGGAALLSLGLLLLGLFSLSTSAVLGTSVVDQEQLLSSYYLTSAATQTFTAGVGGSLDKVSFNFTNVGGGAGDFVVEILSVDGNGVPTSNVLGTGTKTFAPGTNGWQDVPLTTPATVTAGTRYGISFHQTGFGNYYYVGYSTSTTYAGGQLFSGTSNPISGSLQFKTWVDAGGGGGSTETVDQEQLTSNYYVTTNPGSLQAQTFTAGITGSLSKVSFEVTNVGNGAGALVVEIRSVDGSNAPTATVLGTGTVTLPAGTSGWQDVVLTAPVAITAGTRYALVFYETGSGNYYYLNYSMSTVYASGQLFYNFGNWSSTSGSMKFKTWVIPSSGGGGADTVAPVTTASPNPGPSPSGWNTTNVNVTLSCTDNSSGCATTEYMEAQASSDVVDQQQQQAGYYLTSAATQTFTAGVSGSLSKVSFNFTNVGAGAGDLVVEILSVDGNGTPTSNVLGTGTKNFATGTSGWQDVLLAAPVTIAAGTRYGIYFHQTGFGNYYYVGYSPNTAYFAGQLFYGTNSPTSGSLQFKTWMTPPVQSGTVDQQQLTSNYYITTDPGSFNAQTFTAGMSGPLEKVALNLTNVGQDAGSLVLEIRSVDGNGIPTSTVLGTGTVTFPQGTSGWQDIPLASPLTIAAGNKYAIVISETGTGNYHYVNYSTNTVYSGGQLFYGNGVGSWQSVGGSLVFKTVMQVAAPSWLPYTTPILVSSNGEHTLMYRSADQAGNVETAKTLTVRVDKSVPILNLPANITVSTTQPNGTFVFFNVSASDSGNPISASCNYFPGVFPIGTTTVTCTATGAHGGTASGSFLITVSGPSSNADLSSLSLGSVAFSPLFNPAITAYNATVGASTTSVTVVATKADPASQMFVGLSNGPQVPLQNGGPSQPLALSMGNNSITIRVQAQSGNLKVYTLNVLRVPEAPGTPTILSLTPASGQMSMTFAPPTNDGGSPITSYVVTVTGLTNGQSYAFKVNAVNAGGAGNVSAPTGMLLASSDASLSGLMLNTGPLAPAFSSSTTSYSASVPGSVTHVQVRPTAGGTGATIKVRANGGGFSTVASGALSPALSLQSGANAVEVEVTAQNGTTVRTYSIAVTRQTVAMTMAVASVLGTGGGNVTLSATLAADGVALPNKTVNFTLNGAAAGSAITDNLGVASRSASLAGIAAGDYPAGVGASFDAEGDFGAASGTGTLHIDEPTTKLDIVQLSYISGLGGAPTFSVSVQLAFGGSPLIGKLITLAVDGAPVCGGTDGPACKSTGAGGIMSISFSASVPAGPHQLTASFAGDSDSGPASGSRMISISLNPTSLAVTPINANAGATVTLKATLKSGVALPGQMVSFSLNGTPACGETTGIPCPVTNANGVAQLADVSLAGILAGIYPTGIVAKFEVTGNYAYSSGSAALFITASDTKLTLAVPSGVPDGTTTLTATLKSGTTPLFGKTVSFVDMTQGVTPLCGAQTSIVCPVTGIDGKASLSVSLAGLSGPHVFQAVFAGEGNYGSAASNSVLLTLAKAVTTLALPAVNGPQNLPSVVTATLKAGGIGLPDRGIAFKVLGNVVAVAPTNASGVASAIIPPFVAPYGTYPAGVTAEFAGDAGYLPSVDTAQLKLNGVVTALAMSAVTVTAGQPMILEATLTVAGVPLAGKNVNFTYGTWSGVATTNALGKATVTGPDTSAIPVGAYAAAIVATFAGDATYVPDFKSVKLTVK